LGISGGGGEDLGLSSEELDFGLARAQWALAVVGTGFFGGRRRRSRQARSIGERGRARTFAAQFAINRKTTVQRSRVDSGQPTTKVKVDEGTEPDKQITCFSLLEWMLASDGWMD